MCQGYKGRKDGLHFQRVPNLIRGAASELLSRILDSLWSCKNEFLPLMSTSRLRGFCFLFNNYKMRIGEQLCEYFRGKGGRISTLAQLVIREQRQMFEIRTVSKSLTSHQLPSRFTEQPFPQHSQATNCAKHLYSSEWKDTSINNYNSMGGKKKTAYHNSQEKVEESNEQRPAGRRGQGRGKK